MARTTTDNDVLTRRLSDDFIQFKTSHHLPDDLESSIKSNFVFFLFYNFLILISERCNKSSSKTSTRSNATKTQMAIIFSRTNDIQR